MCKQCDAPRVTAAVSRLVDEMHGVRLVSLVTVRAEVDAQIAVAVGDCRANGWSWQQVGDSLGITRQAAHERYRSAG